MNLSILYLFRHAVTSFINAGVKQTFSVTLIVTMIHLVVNEVTFVQYFYTSIVRNYALWHFLNTSLIPLTKFRQSYLVKTTAAARAVLPMQHVQYFCVSKQWYSCQLFGICKGHTHFNQYMRLSCYVPYQIIPNRKQFILRTSRYWFVTECIVYMFRAMTL